MKRNCVIGIALLALSSAMVAFGGPPSEEFTYQGRLKQNGNLFNGTADVVFRLYDAETAGSLVGDPVTFDDLPIEQGILMVNLDFGPDLYRGSERWVEIQVEGETLTPRQELKPAPYAMFALNAPWLVVGSHMCFLDGDVGIGTDTPMERLDVVGNVQADQFISMVPHGTPPMVVASETRVPGLNADKVDGVHQADLARAKLFGIPGGGGSVYFDIAPYHAHQITIGEVFASPQEVAFVHIVENDSVVAWLGFDGAGTMVKGTASLFSSTTILTLKSGNIELKTPGDGTDRLLVVSDFEDVRGMVVWR